MLMFAQYAHSDNANMLNSISMYNVYNVSYPNLTC